MRLFTFLLVLIYLLFISNTNSEVLPFCVDDCVCYQTTVKCVHLNLKSVPFVAAETTVLDLRKNEIKSLNPNAFRHLSRLITLLLNDNQIEELSDHLFAGLAQLKYLYLYNNQIKTIGRKAFKNLHNLQKIYLNHNQIHALNDDTFSDLPSLNKIYLQQNRIERLSREAFSRRAKLETIRLEGNPLACDCELLWLKQVNASVEGTCHSPPQYSGLSVNQMRANNFECKSKQVTREESNDIYSKLEITDNLDKRSKNELIAAIGSQLLLSCESRRGVVWYLNNKMVKELGVDRYGLLANGSLVIHYLLPTDNAIFRCHDFTGNVVTEFEVKVLEPPVFTSVPDSIVEIEAGNTLKLMCAANGFPQPDIKWIRKDRELNRVGTKELTIEDIKPIDNGVYECVANNSLGIAAKTVKIKVKGGQFRLKDQSEPTDNIEILAAVHEATDIVEKAINSTLSMVSDRNRKLHSSGRLMQIARFPLLPESIELAKSVEIYEKSLEILRRKAEAKVKLPTTEFRYEDFLSPNQLNILAHMSGCLVGHRPHNSLITANCDDRCFHARYRSYDGVCNNLKEQLWGASLTPFRRVLPPVYEDGIHLPVGWFEERRYGGFAKPNARKVCQQLLTSSSVSADSLHSHMLMQFGQFLDHDMDFAMPSVSFNAFTGESLDCSQTCQKIAPCFSIEIPDGDPRANQTGFRGRVLRHKSDKRCIELVRSSATCGSGITSVAIGTLMPREQVNQLTAFIDGSHIYGSTQSHANHLRERVPRDAGRLRFTVIDNRVYLPFNEARLPNDCQQDPRRSDFGCFLAGDVRANEQLGLLATHTLWLREHNRVANELGKLNPIWSGERIYQESRKIVGSQLQAITYQHWLAHILGKEGMKIVGKYGGYNPRTNPSVANVFATAALRFGHTLINPFLLRLSKSYEPMANISSRISLMHAFFAPHRLVEEGGIDPLLRGLLYAAAKQPKSDQIMNDELTERLFAMARDVSLDLGSLNVQRGRDHGLPSYNQWRRYCNLSVAHNFDDLEREIRNQRVREKLRHLYGHPDNVDLWVGAVAEDIVSDAKVGPTFRCLLAEQFARTRDGDRFYYENTNVFTKEQLTEIKKTSLARVICDNGDDIERITADVFVIPALQRWTDCRHLPAIDLQKWRQSGGSDECESGRRDEDFGIPLHLLNKITNG